MVEVVNRMKISFLSAFASSVSDLSSPGFPCIFSEVRGVVVRTQVVVRASSVVGIGVVKCVGVVERVWIIWVVVRIGVVK